MSDEPGCRKAVVLAGGKGTRLKPFTSVFPKPLVPLGDTPIMEVVLKQLAKQGFDHVTLAVGHLAELIRTYFGDGEKVGVVLEYVRENEPLGTAGALANVEGLTEPFLVVNGDVLSTLDYAAFLDDHCASGADASISTYTRTDTVDFGVVQAGQDGIVTGYVEKPSTDYLVSMGAYALSPSVLELIEPRAYLDFPDLVLRLLAEGRRVRSVPFDGFWLDIGRHDDFELAQEEFEANRERFLGEDA